MADVAADESLMGGDPGVGKESADAQLGEIFRQASEGANEDNVQVEKPAEEVKPDPYAERFEKLETELRTSRERQIALETENNIHRMGLHRQQQAQPLPEPEPEPTDGIDYDALNAGLRSDPAKTIVKLVADITGKVEERVRKEVTKEAIGATAGMNAEHQAFLQDQRDTIAEYGQYLDKPEFIAAANKIYARITAEGRQVDASGTKWSPNAIYLASSAAFAQLTKAGKLPALETPAAETNPNVVSLVPKRKPAMSPVVGETGPGGVGRRGINPLDHFDADEIPIIRRRAESLGVPFEKYVANFAAMKKRDRGFGGGE